MHSHIVPVQNYDLNNPQNSNTGYSILVWTIPDDDDDVVVVRMSHSVRMGFAQSPTIPIRWDTTDWFVIRSMDPRVSLNILPILPIRNSDPNTMIANDPTAYSDCVHFHQYS
jgi:hypothetical protein